MNHERFLITIKQTVDSSLGKIVAGHRFAAVQVIRDMGFDKRDAHLQQRYVDKLATLGFRASEQSGHDPMGGKYSRGVVDERDTGALGIIQVGDQAHLAAQRLADGIESGLVPVGSALAITGNRAMNQLWI